MLNAVIDISHHQSHVDFVKVKNAGIVGVVHKATQGTRMIDPRYKSRRDLALSVGLLWGAYHFGTGADGSDQADHFLDTVEPDAETLLVLDYEPNPKGLTMKRDQAYEFIEHTRSFLEDRFPGESMGRFPVVYTGGAMLGPSLEDATLGRCPLWWAQYGVSPSRIPRKTWAEWTFWQYTDGAVGPQPRHVDGVGFCDRDKFNGDLEALRRVWLGGC